VKCQLCSNPATVHLTNIIEGQKKKLHLCQACAEKQNLIQNDDLNLSTILQTVIGQHVGPVSDELARLACPECGIKYMEFRAEGRLGCPHDYTAFRAALESLLHKIHRGGKHVGKVPLHFQANKSWQAEIVRLRRQLKTAVEEEAFEEAARLRDLLRQKEARHESG
jgi:protein arginine kinase activator